MHLGHGQKREPFGFVASMIKFLQSVYYAYASIIYKKTSGILVNKMHTCSILICKNMTLFISLSKSSYSHTRLNVWGRRG